MHRTRIVLGLALVWSADIAGTCLLADRDLIVLNGIAVTLTFAAIVLARTRIVIAEANAREASLIRTIERLTGAKTGPIPVLRDVA